MITLAIIFGIYFLYSLYSVNKTSKALGDRFDFLLHVNILESLSIIIGTAVSIFLIICLIIIYLP